MNLYILYESLRSDIEYNTRNQKAFFIIDLNERSRLYQSHNTQDMLPFECTEYTN